MIKVVAVLRRPENVSREEFRRWWLHDHAPIAARTPGLRRYTLSFAYSEDARFDGIAELYFDNEEAREAASRTPQWKAALNDSVAHAGERNIMLMTEVAIVD